MDAIHAALGQGEENRAFNLTRRTRVPPEATGGAFAIWEEEIPAGAGPPLHVHEKEHEVFTVISGRVRFRAGETDMETAPGDVVMIPPGLPHTFKGLEDSVATVMLSPGAASKFFAAVTASGASPETDMDTVVRIAADHNIRFVGPPLD